MFNLNAAALPDWDALKAELMTGHDLTHRQDGESLTYQASGRTKGIDLVLSNTIEWLRSNKVDTGLGETILRASRKIMGSMLASEIVGVQAVAAPRSQVHTLRVRYTDPQPPSPIADLSAATVLSGTAGPRLTIQILKEVVDTQIRRLGFIAFDDADDLAMTALPQLDSELLRELHGLRDVEAVVDGAMVGSCVGDLHAALAVMVTRGSNRIAARTRRGAGNWCVMSPGACTLLKSAQVTGFEVFQEIPDTGNFPHRATPLVGKLCNGINVYCDPYAASESTVLVGYRGNDIDAAVIYSPQIILYGKEVIDPATFEPVHCFRTCSGLVKLSHRESSMGNAADYIYRLGLDPSTLTFI